MLKQQHHKVELHALQDIGAKSTSHVIEEGREQFKKAKTQFTQSHPRMRLEGVCMRKSSYEDFIARLMFPCLREIRPAASEEVFLVN